MALVDENFAEFSSFDDRDHDRLSGITVDEMRTLANRLPFGEEFRSFEEFDLAIDSWGFINNRPCHRLKTQKDFRLRVCREGSRAITRKETVNYAKRVASNPSGCQDETFPSFESFTQGHHIRTGAYDRRNIRMARDGRCGERLRYLTAGSISLRGMSSASVTRLSVPPAAPSCCQWRVKARRKTDTSGVVISVCNLQRTCSTAVMKWRGHTPRVKFIAKIMGDKIPVDLNVKVRNLQEEMRLILGDVTYYHQMWRVREVCRELMNCSNAESFQLIPSLLEKMDETDLGCIIDWSKFDRTDIFCRAFVSPSASRNMFQFCQKVIALDACHSKNRKFPCQIFLASTLDGNKEAVILCFAVAHTEDTNTWTWFCRLMKESVVGIDKETTVIISDRQKGLSAAVEEVFEDIVHGHCAHHILMNLQARFGKALASQFNAILYAKIPERFEGLLNSLEQMGEKGQEMAEYLRKADPWRWARCLFPLPRYGRTTSNLAESLNAAMLSVRFGTAYKILHDIWIYMQQTITTRREKLLHTTGVLTPYALRRLQQNERHSRGLVCLRSNRVEASVFGERGRANYVVKRLDGVKGHCGCYEYQEMLWPCAHGMAFERELGNLFEERFDQVWWLESLHRLYDHNFIPPLDLAYLRTDFTCRAPPEAVRRGRHRIVRIPIKCR